MTLSLALAGVAAVALRGLDIAYPKRTNQSVLLLLRAALIAVIAVAVFLVCGSRVGSLAHAADQVGAIGGDFAGYPMRGGSPPF